MAKRWTAYCGMSLHCWNMRTTVNLKTSTWRRLGCLIVNMESPERRMMHSNMQSRWYFFASALWTFLLKICILFVESSVYQCFFTETLQSSHLTSVGQKTTTLVLTVSFQDDLDKPAWSCSSVSSYAWHAPLFPSVCHGHIQVYKSRLLTYKCRHGLAPDYLCLYTLLTFVPGRPCYVQLLVPRSCTTSFGLRSFGSSGPTAWNDMPAHLHYSDFTLSDFRQLLKSTLFRTVSVLLPRSPL